MGRHLSKRREGKISSVVSSHPPGTMVALIRGLLLPVFLFLSILVAAAVTAATAKRLLGAGALENGEKKPKREISSTVSVKRPLSCSSSQSRSADF